MLYDNLSRFYRHTVRVSHPSSRHWRKITKYKKPSQRYTHTRTRLMALCPGQPGWAGTRKVKPIWILLKRETVSSSGISWAICKSASRSRQMTMPVPHHSIFLTGWMPFLSPKPTASKHWRQMSLHYLPDKMYKQKISSFHSNAVSNFTRLQLVAAWCLQSCWLVTYISLLHATV